MMRTMVLCAVALLATGCGPGGGQRDPGAFEAALDMVPNTEDTRGGTKLVSLDRAREALPATTERGLPPFTDITLRLAQAGIDPGERLWGLETAPGTPIGANLTAAGVDFARVDVVVDAGSDDGFFLAVGSFEPGAITQSVAGCPGCQPPMLDTPSGKLTLLSWGTVPGATSVSSRFQRPFFDGLGRGGTFAAATKALVRTYSVESAETGLDAINGRGPRLTDANGFAGIARALDDSGVIVATIGEVVPASFTRGQANDPPLRPFVAYGVGVGVGPDGAGGIVVTVVIAHATEEDARANRDALQQRLILGRSARLARPWIEAFPQPRVNQGDKLVLLALRPTEAITGATRTTLAQIALALLAAE